MNIFLLKKAVLSEKSMRLAKSGIFTFLVDKSAGKKEIARVIEGKFKVNVLDVKTINGKGQTKMQRTRKGTFTIPGFKKALVKVKSGQKITLFELESQKNDQKSDAEVKQVVSEKKSLLKGTKVKIEKTDRKDSKKSPEKKEAKTVSELKKKGEK